MLRAVASGGGLATAMAAQPQSFLDAVPVTRAVLSSSPAPLPETFREIVALFATNREGGLYGELYAYAHLVRMTAGKLELNVTKKASPQLAARVGQCLTQWTGQRWMVAIVEETGAPTLQEQDKKAEKEREEKVQTHPLMRASMAAFPDAKIVSIKQKESVPICVGPDDDDPLSGEEDD
jgi:DNA polymerase-3 subunit gamma/tau